MQPTSVIKAHLGLEPNGRIQKFFTSECAKAMDKYVPFDEGILADYRIQGNLIIYEQNYARYQYYGLSKSGKPLNYQTDKHPLATSYWDKKMVTADLPDIVKRIQDKFGGK
jgi:hypothetical protein